MPKEHKTTDYANPRFTSSPPKAWLAGRDKHPTGWCNSYQPLKTQSHEGDKVNRRVCDFWESCPCYCHYLIDQMFEMVDMPRPPAEQSPEYAEMVAALHLETQAMLDSLPMYAAIVAVPSSVGGPIPHPDHEGPYTGQVAGLYDVSAARPQPVFAPTPTGRRARGQLEYDVLVICIDFYNKVFDWEECTPKLVSEEIGKRYSIEPPSTGAVNAVWDRWEKLQFAAQGKKPSRFLSFLVENPSVGTLDAIKSRNKRTAKLAQGEQRRAIPQVRPRKRK